MDARLDDPAWEVSAVIDSLALAVGEDGRGQSPLPTQVRLLWDAEFLYVRFIAHDAELYLPEQGRDAALDKGDVAEVFIDAVGDGRQVYELQVNPAGDLFDQLITVTAVGELESNEVGMLDGPIIERDFWPVPGWDMAGLRHAAQSRVELAGQVGWMVDFTIPADAILRRLGQETLTAGTRVGAHLLRYKWAQAPVGSDAPRRLVAMSWAPVVYGCPHISPAAMGTLRLAP